MVKHHRDVFPRVLAKGRAGIGHLRRVGQKHGRAFVRGVMLLQWLDDLEAHFAGVHGVVVGYLGALVVEEHLAGGQEEAQRYLRVPLVRPVAHTQETAVPAALVEEVEIHALVEVLFRAQRMCVVVLSCDISQDRGHSVLLLS